MHLVNNNIHYYVLLYSSELLLLGRVKVAYGMLLKVLIEKNVCPKIVRLLLYNVCQSTMLFSVGRCSL